jgi:hypothetical protein
VADIDGGGGGGARRRNRDFGKDFGNRGSNLPFNKSFDVLRIHGACRAKMTENLSNNKKKKKRRRL